MSRPAWAYIYAIMVTGALLVALTLADPLRPPLPGLTFLVFTALATLAQLFKALFKSQQQSDSGTTTYSPTLVLLFAGVLLLPPTLYVLLVILPHLTEWVKERIVHSKNLPGWYIQPFNIATHIISGLAAKIVFEALSSGAISEIVPTQVFAVIAAALVYMALNHLIVGQVVVLTSGASWRATGTLEPENLISDFVMLCLGYTMAMLWQRDPWLTLPALSPLVLIYRALMVPQLRKDAQTDSKTGLLNARHFAQLVKTEIERAERFARPLSLIMADLDLLRNINNTYGHLAGDVVLSGIGKIIRETIREYDIAARFGGEEFAIMLPEVGPVEAHALAERLRIAVEAARFDVDTSPTPISATLSLGVACFPGDGMTLTTLTHEADVAVYQAKLQGRNRVIFAADVPHYVKLHGTGEVEAGEAQYAAAFASRIAHAGSGYTGAAGPRADGGARTEPTKARALPVSAVPATSVADAPAPLVAQPPAPVAPAKVEEPTSQPAHEQPAERPPASRLLWVYVSTVILAGVIVATAGLATTPVNDWFGLALLVTLAALVELLQINVYGANTVSVSVAFAFAAALVAGVPGAILVSAAIALMHYLRTQPPLYRTAFNWSTHLLAGTAVVLIERSFAVPLELGMMALLLVPSAIAALAYYGIDTGLIATAIALAARGEVFATWQRQFKWLALHYLVLCGMGMFLAIADAALGPLGVVVFALPVLMMRYAQQQYVDQTSKSMGELQRLNEQLARANREVLHASQSIREFNDELFMTLASILDARDPYVGGHAAQVARYATALAIEIGLPAEQVTQVRQAAFLHDIGKIAIPEQILHKPARLTAEEYELVKTHAARGADILQMSKALRHLAPFVRHHHERWNGAGYPGGLRGSDIPLEARILCVCDAVEAMASDRPYQRGMAQDAIIAELRACAGGQFDPDLAATFEAMIERHGAHLIINVARSDESKSNPSPEILYPPNPWTPQHAQVSAA